MTTINVNTVAPAGSVLTVGESGDTIVAVDEIKVNTVKDAGGNTLWVSNGSGTLSSVSSGFGGALNLIQTQTASGSASLDFTLSTYKEYVFKFININPVTDDTDFMFATGTPTIDDGLSTITSTFFVAYHSEDGSQSGLSYDGSKDLAQQDTYQGIMWSIGNGSDEAGSGELHIFNPASTTYVKNWYSICNNYDEGNTTAGRTWNGLTAGYCNQTGAITEIRFKMSSGNFDGKIKLYGVS